MFLNSISLKHSSGIHFHSISDKNPSQKNIQTNCSNTFLFVFIFGVLFSFSPGRVMAQGNLLIIPRRVVFEGAKKSEELNIANTGKDTATYIISVINIRMNEDGSFEQISEPDSGQSFAGSYLRFFPHKVTLAPNEGQVVKIQLTKTNELTSGEYRSHVYFRAVPDEKPLTEKEPAPAKDAEPIKVLLTPIFGITIPVIIRVGESSTKVKFSDLSFAMVNDTIPAVNVTFNRTGNMSVYGGIKVDYISDDGKTTTVGNVKGIAVYTPNPKRRFQIQLAKEPGIDYHKGKLHITYTTDVKTDKFTEGEIVLK